MGRIEYLELPLPEGLSYHVYDHGIYYTYGYEWYHESITKAKIRMIVKAKSNGSLSTDLYGKHDIEIAVNFAYDLENESSYKGKYRGLIHKKIDDPARVPSFTVDTVYTTEWCELNDATNNMDTFTIDAGIYNIAGGTGSASHYEYYTLYIYPEKCIMAIDSESITIGKPVTFAIDRSFFDASIQSSYVTCDLTYKFGDLTGTIVSDTSQSKITWTPDATSFSSQMKKTMSKKIEFYLYTYSIWGLSERRGIGYESYTNTVIIPSYKITLSDFSTSIYNNVGSIPAYLKKAVRTWTKLDWSVNASTKYGASISKYELIFGNARQSFTTNSGRTSALLEAGSYTPSLVVTDSRGITETISGIAPITVLDYNPPEVTNITVYRCKEDGTRHSNNKYVYISCSATLGENSNFDGRNKLDIYYKYRILGETSWSSSTRLTNGVGVIIKNSSGELIEFNKFNSYEINFYLTDSFGSRIIDSYILKSARIALHLKKNGEGAAFGKLSETDKLLDTDWNGRIGGDLTVGGKLNVGGKDLGPVLLYQVAGDKNISCSNTYETVVTINITEPGMYMCVGETQYNETSETTNTGHAKIENDGGYATLLGLEGHSTGTHAYASCTYVLKLISGTTTIKLKSKVPVSPAPNKAVYGQLFVFKLSGEASWEDLL